MMLNGACDGPLRNCSNNAGLLLRKAPVNVTSGSKTGQDRSVWAFELVESIFFVF